MSQICPISFLFLFFVSYFAVWLFTPPIIQVNLDLTYCLSFFRSFFGNWAKPPHMNLTICSHSFENSDCLLLMWCQTKQVGPWCWNFILVYCWKTLRSEVHKKTLSSLFSPDLPAAGNPSKSSMLVTFCVVVLLWFILAGKHCMQTHGKSVDFYLI